MSITKRSRNVYRFVTDGPPDPVTGARRQITTTFRGSAADAKIAHATWVLEQGQTVHGSTSLTYADLLVRYLQHLEGRVERRTLDNRKRDARLHLLPTLGPVPLKDLKASHFDDLYSQLAKKLAASTIVNVHTLATASLKQAIRWEWVTKNVAALATPPPVHRREPYAPPSDDVYRLLDHLMTTDYPLFVFTDLVAMTGMRPAEACALRWCDVDLDAGVISVTGSVPRSAFGRDRKDTKTHKERSLHIDDELVLLLEKWQVECSHPPAGKYLFSNEPSHTMPWRPDTIANRLKRHRERLKMGPVTYRGMRHHVATHLIANGVDIVTVAKRLGHSNPAMTLNVYASAVPKNDKAAAELLRAMRKGKDDG